MKHKNENRLAKAFRYVTVKLSDHRVQCAALKRADQSFEMVELIKGLQAFFRRGEPLKRVVSSYVAKLSQLFYLKKSLKKKKKKKIWRIMEIWSQISQYIILTLDYFFSTLRQYDHLWDYKQYTLLKVKLEVIQQFEQYSKVELEGIRYPMGKLLYYLIEYIIIKYMLCCNFTKTVTQEVDLQQVHEQDISFKACNHAEARKDIR